MMKTRIFTFSMFCSLVILSCGGDDADPNFTMTAEDAQAVSSDDTEAVAQIYTDSVDGASSYFKAALQGTNEEFLKNTAATVSCGGGGTLAIDIPTLATLTTVATSGGTLTLTATATNCVYTSSTTDDAGNTYTYDTTTNGTITTEITVPAGGYTASQLGTGAILQTLVAEVSGTDVTFTYKYTVSDGSEVSASEKSTFTITVNPADSDYYMTGSITTAGTYTETVDGTTYTGTCDATATIGVDTTLNPEIFTNSATIEGKVAVSCKDSTGVSGSYAFSYAVELTNGEVTTITTTPVPAL